MELEEVIKSRRSIRKFRNKQVDLKDILDILNFAIWAPSAHNSMPYFFMIIDSQDIKQELVKEMAKEYENDLKKDKIPDTLIERIIRESVDKFTVPPILIIPCLSMERMHKYPDQKRQNAEYTMAIQSVSAAIQNLLLTSHSHGLGCCWYCAPLFCQDAIRKVLKIPKEYDPQAIITVGYPGESPLPPKRLKPENLSFINEWGQKF